eukprot:scaffold512043_cov28-Prasinocladus_malaysianus.AAC.1
MYESTIYLYSYREPAAPTNYIQIPTATATDGQPPWVFGWLQLPQAVLPWHAPSAWHCPVARAVLFSVPPAKLKGLPPRTRSRAELSRKLSKQKWSPKRVRHVFCLSS